MVHSQRENTSNDGLGYIDSRNIEAVKEDDFGPPETALTADPMT
jgi:hypothetical protein